MIAVLQEEAKCGKAIALVIDAAYIDFAGDEEELLKVDISYGTVKNDYFNIPSEYKDGNM